ncbi:MAG: formate dehydrogenase accessory sulfurtransferase FdhD [Dokdonella sp.]
MRPRMADSAIASTGYVRREVRRWRNGRSETHQDCIAEEVPVALLYNDYPHVVMMATPRDLDDFALGFSLSEGVIENANELGSIEIGNLLEGIELRLRIPAARADALEARQRNLTGRTSCGLCGTQALEDAVRQPARVAAGVEIDAATLHRALAQLHERQPLNAATGATHAAAWAHADGTLRLLREDVGRHNALDKLIGAMGRADEEVCQGFLIITSRASYEMVQKAATVGIPTLAAISAPTALAIQLAESTGVTLIGFARDESHVVYAQRLPDAGVHAENAA